MVLTPQPVRNALNGLPSAFGVWRNRSTRDNAAIVVEATVFVNSRLTEHQTWLNWVREPLRVTLFSA